MSSIMTSLIDLPAEMLIIIIKQLDIKSVFNLYKTCATMKNIILMQGAIRRCKLSCNSLATAKSLQLDMIKGISVHLHELNMCGVLNLRKNVLLPALKRMRCLKTLDVSYTEISLLDIVDIYTNCSTIKNITIDFSIEDIIPDKPISPKDHPLNDYCEVFKNFNNVHFVTTSTVLGLPLNFLRKSSLDTLKFTLHSLGCRLLDQDIEFPCPFKHLCIFMVDHNISQAYKETWSQIAPLVKIANIEYIILEYQAKYSVCASPLFIEFFSKNFNITSFSKLREDKELCGIVAIFIWDKEKTVFDEIFFANLKRRIRKVLACEIKVISDETSPSANNMDSFQYDCFHIFPNEIKINQKTDNEPNFKRRRIVQSDYLLDYDDMFSASEKIQLSVFFTNSMNATLSSSSNYLRKLTYLSLSGSFVRYSNDFFNILFRCCTKLVTLNVESSSTSHCSSFIIRSIPLSQSLKNVRLVDKRIDFKTLFSSFTQCRTLENICIIDSSSELNKLASLGALYQCCNLYSLHIQAAVTNCTVIGMINMHKKLLKNRFEHINFVLKHSDYCAPLNYYPYLSIFNISPIKPV